MLIERHAKPRSDTMRNHDRLRCELAIDHRANMHSGAGACLFTGGAQPARAAETWFNPALLSGGDTAGGGGVPEAADLSRFESGEQIPGTYRVDIYINQTFVDTRDVNFTDNGQGGLVPALTLDEYRELGLNTAAVSALRDTAGDAVITDMARYIPAAGTSLEFARQRLNISLPQLVMHRRAAGYVDPASWDDGVPAALLNYTLTGNSTRYRGSSSAQGSSGGQYASLRGGLNWGGAGGCATIPPIRRHPAAGAAPQISG